MKGSARQTAFVVCMLLLAGTGLNAQPAAVQACTNATLTGPYGYLLGGNLIEQGSLAPYVDMGSLTADGKGNFSGSGTESFAGTIETGTTITGSYIVNTDCTASASLTFSNGIGNFHYNLIILNNGKDFRLLQTDSGSIVSGGARQQEANCVLESINGSYALAIDGSFFDSTGNVNPYSDTGKINFNGTGSLSLNDAVSEAGTLTSRNISGAYTTHSNCTGAVTFNDTTSGTTFNMNIAVVDGGQEIFFIDTDSGVIFSGNARVLGDVEASGTMAQVASGGGWVTTFTLTNTGTSPANIELSFFDNNGDPLALPLTILDSGENTTTSTLSETIAPGASLLVTTHAGNNAALVTGSAVLKGSGGNAGGFAVFDSPAGQEAVVPLETRTATSYILAFDNTNGLATGLALANVSNQPVKVPLIVRDDTGAELGTATISLAAHGHTSFLLATNYGFAKNKRGTVEFDTPANGQISALGLRAKATGSVTTIPVLVK